MTDSDKLRKGAPELHADRTGRVGKEPSHEYALESTVHTDFRDEMSYASYLQLDRILNSQDRHSGHHDEMLFIIIHQTSELWMKLVLHELRAAVRAVAADSLEPAVKMLARVARVQEQLIQSWDVLSTLTPTEYTEFRDLLGHASGFQSYQNRMIEFTLGYKRASVLAVYAHDRDLHARMAESLALPSIYDAAIAVLAKRGLSIDADCLERDWADPYLPNASVQAAWLTVYRNVDEYWDLYELAEKLVDIEDRQQQWRFNHMKTVERIIGYKMGTGGSSGVGYLKSVLEHRFFPELWQLRTEL